MTSSVVCWTSRPNPTVPLSWHSTLQISAANSLPSYSINRSPYLSESGSSDPTSQNSTNANNSDITKSSAASNQQKSEKPQELSDEEKQQVAKLQARDQEVRAHEAAHLAAAAGIVRGGASFSYQTGPDGRAYAGIDTSPVKDDPQATIQKARTIRAAALAPAQPSGADQAVAAAASKLEASARVELAVLKAEEQQEKLEGKPDHGETVNAINEPTESSLQAGLSEKNVND